MENKIARILPAEMIEAIVLHLDKEGYTWPAISAQTGLTVEQVRAILCIVKLREKANLPAPQPPVTTNVQPAKMDFAPAATIANQTGQILGQVAVGTLQIVLGIAVGIIGGLGSGIAAMFAPGRPETSPYDEYDHTPKNPPRTAVSAKNVVNQQGGTIINHFY